MKVVVYFESGNSSDVVAHFASEELYMACLRSLEDVASDGGYFITESLREDEDIGE